jgi:hypothetical protein
LDDVCGEREVVGGDGGGEGGVGCFGVDGGVHFVGGCGREGDGAGGCGGHRFVGVEGEDIWEARGLVQEGLQVRIGLEDRRRDENVIVADDLFCLLAYEGEESSFCHGRRRLSGVD